MGSPLEQALATLIGRDPSSEEVQKFYKVKEVCGLSEHDAMWSLLLAFGHYEILYREIPEAIAGQAHKLLAEHRLGLEATAHAAGSLVQKSLAEAVSRSAHEMAASVMQHAARRTRTTFVASLGVAAVVIGCIGAGAFWAGQMTSAAEAAWLNTPEGKAAKAFSSLNNVRAMLDCPDGFPTRDEAKGTYCLPIDPNGKKAFGWRIK